MLDLKKKIMKHFKITMSILVLIFSNLLVAQDNFNLTSSTIKWIGKEISTKSHYGSLQFSSAELDFDGETLNGGTFVVDMTTLQVEDLSGKGKQRLEGHLRSDDFFSVEKHTTATLLITKPSSPKEGVYSVDGTLTIKGITHPVRFTLEGSPSSSSYTAQLAFDRAKYNVQFRSGSFFENLGDKLILDTIELGVTLVKK